MMLKVVSFVNEGASARMTGSIKPILFKMVFFTAMITLAMILIHMGVWIGYAIYVKEVVEFIVFIWFLMKERRYR